MPPLGWKRLCGSFKPEHVIVLTAPLPLVRSPSPGPAAEGFLKKSRLIREIWHVQSPKSPHRNCGDGGEKEDGREVGKDQM